MTDAVFSRETVTESTKPRPRLMLLDDLLDEMRADADAAHAARTKGVARGPLTSLTSFDRELGGFLNPGLHVLHAGPGVGKTALALQVGAECGCPCLFVSTEMRALELLRRVTARLTETYLGRLKSGEYTAEQVMAKARAAIAKAPQMAIADATRAFAPAAWIRDAALALRDRAGARHVLIVVDSAHSWAQGMEGREASEYDRLNHGLEALRAIASELVCPVLAIAERNRATMKDGGLNSSAGSRRFEYMSETVFSLDAKRGKDDDETPVPNASGDVEVTLRIAKNRNGSPGARIPLLFNGALQRFREA